MGSYSSTTGNISLYPNDPWQAATFPAITIASGEVFYRFKVTKSNTLSGIELQNSAKSQTMSFDTWYTDYSYIGSTLSAANVNVRNTSSSMKTTTFTLTVETTVSSYSITATVTPTGSGTASLSASSAASGATITVTCTPSTGYQAGTPTATGITFTSLGNNKWSFTMPSSNVAVSCPFSKVSYSVSVGVSPSGSGTLTTNKATANYGDTVTLTKSPASEYYFSSWTTTPSNLSINSSNQFTMPAANVIVTANFTRITYAVSVTAGTGGNAVSSVSSAASGATVTITSTPNTGYSANTPTASGISFTSLGSNKWSFTMPSNAVAVSCTYTHVSHTISVGVSPSGSGTLTRSPTTAYYNDVVTLSRTPATGYQFSSWTTTPSNLSINSSLKFTMPDANVSVTANFTKINYTVGKSQSSNGSFTLSKETANYQDVITVTTSPNTGYAANTPTASGVTFTSAGANKWTFSMPANNITVSCTFYKVTYTVGKTTGSGGTASLSSSTANYGDTITVTCSPSSGFVANTPTASGVTFTPSSTNKWTFSMPANNVTVSCTFSNNRIAVVAGNIIRASDRSQAGISTTVGAVMTDSNFSAGTKIQASTFNSQVLGK